MRELIYYALMILGGFTLGLVGWWVTVATMPPLKIIIIY